MTTFVHNKERTLIPKVELTFASGGKVHFCLRLDESFSLSMLFIFWGQVIFLLERGAVLSIVGCLAASLVSGVCLLHGQQHYSLQCDNQKVSREA